MSRSYVDLSYAQLLIASFLILLSGAISIAMRLGLARRIFLAAARMVVQLLLVGLVLQSVFSSKQWRFVVLVMLAMSTVAGVAAVQRTTRRYPGVWLNSVISIFSSSWVVIAIALLGILRVKPWYSPQYAIPIMGMILGNAISGVSLALDRFGEELTTHRDQVETLLALGGDRHEAARLPIRNAVSTGMIPTINVMVVAGIVTMPGTMTGQLLAGVDPLAAVKYQIVIMFILAASTTMAIAAAVFLSSRDLFTRNDQFLYWKLSTRNEAEALRA